MHFFGLLIYIIFTLLVLFVDFIKDFYLLAFSLSNIITVGVSIFLFYPLVIFFVLEFSSSEIKHKKNIFTKHASMSASIAVSLGLIGTFIGLVDMIGGISSALNGNVTDFEEKMNQMLSSIGVSLTSMSFAFVTSILGIAASTVISFATTFMSQRFELLDATYTESEHVGSINNSFHPSIVEQKKLIEDIKFILDKNIVSGNNDISDSLRVIQKEITTFLSHNEILNKELLSSLSHQKNIECKLDDIYSGINEFHLSMELLLKNSLETSLKSHKSISENLRGNEKILLDVNDRVEINNKTLSSLHSIVFNMLDKIKKVFK